MSVLLRSCFIIGSLMAAFCSHAQIYTGVNFPGPGSNYPMYVDASIGADITESMLLAPAPWYFSQISYDYLDTVKFLDPANTPFGTSFPTASVAVVDSFISDFFSSSYLFQSGGDIYSLGGTVTPPSEQDLPLPYGTPVLWLNLPVEVGSSFSTTSSSTIMATGVEVGVPADSISLHHYVTSHDTVDAVGHLTFPGLILDNAIRRIRTDSIIDSIFIKTNGVWSYDPNINEGSSVERFVEWYHADHDWLVAQAYIKDEDVRGIRYVPGPPPSIRLEFSSLPSDISILDTIPNFTVSAFNIASGLPVTNFSDSVRISTFQDTTNGWWADFNVDEASVVPASGIATFNNLWFYNPGSYRLLAWSDTVAADTSMIINVHPVATHLDLNINSSSTESNTLIPTITVSALNDSGYVDDLFYQGSVRVGKISGLGELTGTITRPLINGVATFDDLRITDQGTYQLVFYTPVNQRYLVQDTLTASINPTAGDWTYAYTDTLNQYVDRANEFVWFGNADGYLSGTSRGGYSEVGQHFDFVGRGRITKVLCHFANRLHVGDDTDTFELKIYDAGLLEANPSNNQNSTTFMDSVPLTLLGSQLFAADSMQFGDFWIQEPTTIRFENPPLVTSSFIISLVGDSELSNDTIMLWHSIIGDGQGEYRTVRLMTSFGSSQEDTLWIRDKYWRPSFNVDLMVSPVVEFDTLSTITGTQSSVPSQEISIFPNPTADFVSLNWIDQPDVHVIEMYSGARRVYRKLVSGRTDETIDLKSLPPGTYLVCLRTETGLLVSSTKVIRQ